MTEHLHSWTFIPEKWKSMFRQKPGHGYFSNFMCNGQMSVYGGMVKQSVVHPQHGVLLGN